MKKILMAMVMAFSANVFAAKFIRNIQPASTELLALKAIFDGEVSGNLVGESSVLGADYGLEYYNSEIVAFTRKATEKNISTIKQFAIGQMNQTPDDEEGTTAVEISNSDAADAVNTLLYVLEADFLQDDELLSKVEPVKQRLVKRISAGLSSGKLKVFGGNHSYEDGSWGILLILDESTQEILALDAGYTGT